MISIVIVLWLKDIQCLALRVLVKNKKIPLQFIQIVCSSLWNKSTMMNVFRFFTDSYFNLGETDKNEIIVYDIHYYKNSWKCNIESIWNTLRTEQINEAIRTKSEPGAG